jgi:hypothetical protein
MKKTPMIAMFSLFTAHCLLLTCFAAAAANAADTTVLTTKGPWRYHLLNRTPVVPAEAMQAAGKTANAPVVLPAKAAWGGPGWLTDYTSPALPPGWTDATFDDADWARGSLPDDFSVSTGMVAARGRFLVADPAKVTRLQLTLKYRGGAVVYLNGKEVARWDLPDGAVTPATVAKAYENDVYLTEAGKLITDEEHALRAPQSDEAKRVEKRTRVAAPVELPVAALRKGVNVLAVAALRSEFLPPALKWWDGDAFASGRAPQWTPVGVRDLSLVATGEGVQPPDAARKGIQVWNLDLHDRLDGSRIPELTESSLKPVTIVGARNGFFSGALALSCDAAMNNVQVAVSELTGAGGAKLPAAAVQARAALWAANVGHYDTLPAAIPSAIAPYRGNASAPIWITVRVPRDAAAGEYRGEVTVSAENLAPVKCPLVVRVAAWTLPDPKDFRTYVGMCQSPDTLAEYYQVPMWSEAHWKLMDKSFALMGEIGNKLLHVPILNRTQLGNDEGLIWWVKQADGTYDYDFSVFDRYLEAAKKHCGTLEFVVCHVWISAAWGNPRALDQELYVTCVDKATGKHERLRVPTYATPESKAFWTPVMTAVRQRLAKAGFPDALALGNVSDQLPAPQAVKMFSEIVPGAGWWQACHSPDNASKPFPLREGGTVVLHEHCYGLNFADLTKGFPQIWNQHGPAATYMRGTADSDPGRVAFLWRQMPENALYYQKRGVGRECIDYWPMPHGDGEHGYRYARWPTSKDGHSMPFVGHHAQPDTDGPVTTIRHELFREGLQEAEAAMLLAEAAATKSDVLGKELTEKCRRISLDRFNAVRVTRGVLYGGLDTAGWQQRSEELYQAAAEVSAKLK